MRPLTAQERTALLRYASRCREVSKLRGDNQLGREYWCLALDAEALAAKTLHKTSDLFKLRVYKNAIESERAEPAPLVQAVQPLPDRLICPRVGCGCNEIHQIHCDVLFRDEDAAGVLVRRGKHLEQDVQLRRKDADAFAGGRRDAIVISFECERCRAVSRLRISQNIGCTEMCWITE